MNYYNLDGIKTELQKRLSEHETILKCWLDVEFLTKKDGSPFKNMSQNFKNAKYVKNEYSINNHEYILKVGGWDDRNGYINDSIHCYELVKYLKDETRINKIDNYMPKETLLEQVYKFDIEDIKNAVNNRITYHADYVEELKEQIENIDMVYNEFKTAYGDAIKTLKNNTSNYKHNDLYNLVFHTVKERYPYC